MVEEDGCYQKKMNKTMTSGSDEAETASDSEDHHHQKKNRIQSLSYSHLPTEVIGEIMKTLSLTDQIRLSFVCKNWFDLPIRNDNLLHKLPWIVFLGCFGGDNYLCKLFTPIDKKPYSIYPMITHSNLRYCTSKNGWLLIRSGSFGTSHGRLTLFCPFTNETMELPYLCYCHSQFTKRECLFATNSQRAFTISSNPRSKECVYFSFNFCNFKGSSELPSISTYKHGDKGWTTIVVDELLVFVKSAVFYKGDFYCVSPGGFLMVYRVANHKLYLVENSSLEPPLPNVKLVVSEGELLLVSLDPDIASPCLLFRFNWSSMRWDSITHLPNQTIFLGCLTDYSSFAIPALGDTAFLANKIFYIDQISYPSSRAHFYDLNDEEIHDCEHTDFDSFFTREEEYLKPIWIEPLQPNMLKPHEQEEQNQLDLILAQNPEDLQLISTWML